MTWEPLSLTALTGLIAEAEARMTPKQLGLWSAIKITPVRWDEETQGPFWIVALNGNQVLWYNDIEEGFNLSTYREHGTIEQYFCNQDPLEWTVQSLLEPEKPRLTLLPPPALSS
ncbi:hypothetical protein [Pseudomonas tohonis]|uniref:hypothetical protein n=1 Tax=Pseudomonas tohonis TaxID=2725477 RepID=UPI001F2D4864|nr:hypothetical protein [Pseudomonas tohonis]